MELPTVFIVDDDDGSREAVAALVRSLPALIETFASAEAFLQAFDVSRRGCLVLDIRMPGMSGLELYRQLRERNSQIPVIVITASGDVPMAVFALRAGVLTFLQKPSREHELWEAIRDALALDAKHHEHAQKFDDIQRRLGSLSDEERQVMDMMLEDVPCKSIAKRLGIGMRTAQARRAAVFEKMSADSLPQLALLVHSVQATAKPNPPTMRLA